MQADSKNIDDLTGIEGRNSPSDLHTRPQIIFLQCNVVHDNNNLPGFDCYLAAWWQARALAFSSEVGVAGKAILPVNLYRLAWALSGTALVADITTKCMDAPEDKILHTV